MKSKNRSMYKKSEKMSRKSKIALFIILTITFLIVFAIIDDEIARNEFLSELVIKEAQIVQIEKEDNKNYIRVMTDQSFEEGYDWVEVKDSFLVNKTLYSKIGIMVGKYEVYKKKYWGWFGDKGQNFEKSVWSIDEVYDSVEIANSENPKKEFVEQSKIVKKKITSSNDYFLVLLHNDRNHVLQVTKDEYNKFQVNDNVDCSFETIGQLEKCIRLKEDKS